MNRLDRYNVRSVIAANAAKLEAQRAIERARIAQERAEHERREAEEQRRGEAEWRRQCEAERQRQPEPAPLLTWPKGRAV